jgi:DNA-binding CsgD family transcriptional regulator
MSTKKGLIHIDPESLKWRQYGPEDGLQDQIFNPGVCFQSRNRDMYFGGISGFNYFDPEDIQVNSLPPPVVITSYQTAAQIQETILLNGIQSLRVTRDDLPVLIKMAALSFAFPQKNYYRVKTLEKEQKKIHSGTHNYFYLRDLKPGQNRYLIQASNHDRTWNETGIELTVHLSSPSSRYVPFVLTGLLLAVMALLLFYRQKQRALPKRSIHGSQIDLDELSEHFRLTHREKEIMALLLEGKTNQEIEKELYISLQTVKSHVYNIYQKLNVQNRLQLINTIRDYFNKKNR